MSLKHAILGFLSYTSLSGYELKKAFDQSVQHFWPANQSQIYRTLAELHAQGWVTQEVIQREERLDLKRYHITESGRAELQRWLATPLPPQDLREPFLIQVYFGGQLSDEEFLRLLAHEQAAAEERLALYSTLYQHNQAKLAAATDRRALFLSILTLENGLRSNQILLEWLKSVIDRVRLADYSLP